MRKLIVRIVACTSLAQACFADPAIDGAVRYLSAEVPKWASENKCYSCHNNGDGARALYVAIRHGHPVANGSLADTTAWLLNPDQWRGKADDAISDKKLARIQYASALLQASRAGAIQQASPLARAADSLLSIQDADGAWHIDSGEAPGSPATYGTSLATHTALLVLRETDPAKYREEIAKATLWLRRLRPKSNVDRAVLVLNGLMDPKELMAAQGSTGGWGPHPGSPAEVFDTALALIALQGRKGTGSAVARGRAYLVKEQLKSGGWVETTRPSGNQSYAQHVSTTAWATLALLETDAKR